MGDPNVLWAGIFGGIGTATVALTSVFSTNKAIKYENARAEAQFRQSLKSDKERRLRELYEPFVSIHLELRRITSEQAFTFVGETVEQRDKRHLDEIQAASLRAMKQYSFIVVDPEAQAVKKLLDETSETGYDLFMKAAGSSRTSPTTQERAAFASLVDRVHDAIIFQLSEMGEAEVIRTPHRRSPFL